MSASTHGHDDKKQKTFGQAASHINMKLTILVVFAAISCCFADDDHGKNAPLYTTDNFKDEVSNKPHFVMFFAPW